MVKRHIFYLGIIFISLCSCGQEHNEIRKQTSKGKVFYPFNKTNLVSKSQLVNAITDISYFKIGSKDTLILSKANQIIAVNDNYVLIDRKLHFAYLLDSEGTVQRKLGEFGAKLGEYLSVDNVIYDKKYDELLMFSSQKKAILYFDLSGNFKSEVNLDFFAASFKVLEDGNFGFFVGQNKSEVSKTNDIIITDRKGKVLSTGYDWNPLPGVGFDFSGGFSSSESKLVNISFNDSLYEVTSEKIRLKYIINFGNRTFPSESKPLLKSFPKSIWKYSAIKLPFAETKNYLSIVYNDGMELEVSVFNKATGKSLKYSTVKDVFPFNFLLPSCGATYDTDYFYSILSISTALNFLNKHPEEWSKLQSFNPSLYRILKESTLGDNPIILKFKFSF